MSRGNKSMSKFQFFDIVEGKEPPVKPESKQPINDNDPKSKLPPIGVIELSNVTPSQMYASEGVVFVFGKVIRRTSEYLVKYCGADHLLCNRYDLHRRFLYR